MSTPLADSTSSHIGDRVDDPFVWGVLPLSYAFDPTNLRWGLGAHDICFKNQYVSHRTSPITRPPLPTSS